MNSGSMTNINGRDIVKIGNHLGFDSILTQIEKKLIRDGFTFNLMLVGESGAGKSTFINSLCGAQLMTPASVPEKTTEIRETVHVISESNVRMRLKVIDTPGWGDQIDNTDCWDALVRYIQDQNAEYLQQERAIRRPRNIQDNRVHCVLFFISPRGSSLRPLEIVTLQVLSRVANVVPVIAKADTLTAAELNRLKGNVRQEFLYHQIPVYPQFMSSTDFVDANESAVYDFISESIPYAVIGAEAGLEVEGKPFQGRRKAAGLVDILNPEHCEFVLLHDLLMRTHLQDLIETTKAVHYENYRSSFLTAAMSAGEDDGDDAGKGAE